MGAQRISASSSQAPSGLPTVSGAPAPASSSSQAAPRSAGLVELLDLRGSGPFGIPTPGDAQRVAARLEQLAAGSLPRLSELLSQPGARDLAQEMAGQLVRRFAARAIKLAFGGQALLVGAAGSKGGGSSGGAGGSGGQGSSTGAGRGAVSKGAF